MLEVHLELSTITTSAQAAASESDITFNPSLSAFFILEEPSLSATTTFFTPLSFKLKHAHVLGYHIQK